jgi:hypothetical protein
VKRTAVLLAISSLVFFGSSKATLAQEQSAQEVLPEEDRAVESVTTDYIVPPDVGRPAGFLGQDHYYSIVFRGNGEAVVSVRVIFTNKEDEAQDTLSLRIPKVEPRELSVYQIIKEKTCVRYEQQQYDPVTRTYTPSTRRCLQYQEPDYYQVYGNVKYQKAEFDYEGDTLTVTLPTQVAAQSSGSFFVYFRAFGYTEKNLYGAYTYKFETLKAEDEIRNLRVGISTDSDLVLKGAKGEVNYRFDAPALESAGGIAMGAAPQTSAALDSVITKIGQGSVTKTASNLSPLESYTVDGAYASSRFRLYGKEITIAAVVVIVLLVLTVLAVRFLISKLGRVEGKPKEEPTSKDVKDEKPKTYEPASKNFLLTAAVSFATSFLMAGYTVFVMLLGQALTNIVNYQYNAFVVLALVIISFAVYSLLLFAPSFYIGRKYGMGWGIGCVVGIIVWLLVFLFFGVLFIFFLSGGSRYPTPLPLSL